MTLYRQLLFYLIPSIILTLVFFVFPLLFLAYMSFHQWTGVGPANYVGLQNFAYLWSDPSFRRSLINTFYWIAAGIFVHTPLALLVAVILAKRPRGWKIYRTIFFIPNVISTTAIAFLWYLIFHVEVGLLNGLLNAIGLHSWTRSWLTDPRTALVCTQIPFIIYIGFATVLFLNQISSIPFEYYEAAMIDGASAWQQDLYITIPLVKRAVAIQTLLVTGYCLKMFEYPFIMTGGGPAEATMNISLYIYRKMIRANLYGLSMAAGLVTIIVGVVMMSAVFAFLRWSEREE
ncbi:MAG TPA: sugar ABC transporter permease [Desulfobacterales bacterium]|nr:sugar ABC transporter permease [Desulfobacterales bacterium]